MNGAHEDGAAYVIAELCQNHRGDKGLLREMIWAAAESGARYAKIQSMWAADLTFRPQFEAEFNPSQPIVRPFATEYARVRSLEFDREAHEWFINECERAGITPLTTIFAVSRVPAVAALEWPERAVKVASYDCGSLPLLRSLQASFDFLIVSTGASFEDEIRAAAAQLAGSRFALLLCSTIYPCPLEHLNLRRLATLRQLATTVGFSDHTAVDKYGITASLAALALGADLVERHFTLLPRSETRDGPVSISADELTSLAAFAALSREDRAGAAADIPELDRMLGDATLRLSDSELANRAYYRGRFSSAGAGGRVFNWQAETVPDAEWGISPAEPHAISAFGHPPE